MPAAAIDGTNASARVEVPYPPPPARVELIPAQRDPAQVWVDGQWDWNLDDWVWRGGEWTTPPSEDAYFTPWTTVRAKDGRLYFVAATWRSASGDPIGGGSLGCARAPSPVEE